MLELPNGDANDGIVWVARFGCKQNVLTLGNMKAFRKNQLSTEYAAWLHLFELDLNARDIYLRFGNGQLIGAVVLDGDGGSKFISERRLEGDHGWKDHHWSLN